MFRCVCVKSCIITPRGAACVQRTHLLAARDETHTPYHQDPPAPAQLTPPSAVQNGVAMQEDVREAVLVAVTLNMDLNNVRDGGGLGDVEAFKRDVASDVSRALELDVRSVKVLRLQAGMLQCPALGNIVDFEITPHGRCNGRDLHQALVEQAKDSRSALMSGKYTSKTLAISPPCATPHTAKKLNDEHMELLHQQVRVALRSSIYMYKNDVVVMHSHSKKTILFFLFHKLHDHILPPLPTSFLYTYDILLI